MSYLSHSYLSEVSLPRVGADVNLSGRLKNFVMITNPTWGVGNLVLKTSHHL